jgi:hypothetical protein
VTRQNLYYRLEKLKNSHVENGTGNKSTNSLFNVTVVTNCNNNMAVLSDITNDNICNKKRIISHDNSEIVKNVGGRKKGSKKVNKKKIGKNIRDVVSECTFKYQKQVEDAKKAGKVVPHGTLKEIIKEEEEKNGLEVNSISFETVCSRVKRGNLKGYNPQQSSPMHNIKPIIFEFCVWLAIMGKPLTKITVIELANSLVSGTEIESKISDCKTLQKLNKTNKLGSAWYKGFLKCYSDELSRSGSVFKDIRRRLGLHMAILKTCMTMFTKQWLSQASQKKLRSQYSMKMGCLPSMYLPILNTCSLCTN